jgi:hypothetical protein
MSDYDPLFQLPSGTDDIESVFRTGRGSTYAHHSDATTTRNRSGANHTDTRTGIQQRSGRTVFVDPKDVNNFAGLFQNPDMATQLLPELDASGKPTGKVQLVLSQDYGPRKAGSVLYTAPYTTKPAVGLNPVEIYASESPLNDAGRGVHFGNAITEVQPRPAKAASLLGKAGIAAALASAVGAARAGDFGKAAGIVGESMLPWGATPSAVAPGTLSPDMKAEQDAYNAQQQAKKSTFMPNNVDFTLPDNYRRGGRVRMI